MRRPGLKSLAKVDQELREIFPTADKQKNEEKISRKDAKAPRGADQPQMNQPSSGSRRTMAGRLQICADKEEDGVLRAYSACWLLFRIPRPRGLSPAAAGLYSFQRFRLRPIFPLATSDKLRLY
jgi:hypothetical protein